MTERTKRGLRQSLREDFIAGVALKDEDLIELLLGYAIQRGDLKPLARSLMEQFGGLDGVLSADFEALCQVKGIKSYTATLIKVAGGISSRAHAGSPAIATESLSMQSRLAEPSTGLPPASRKKPSMKASRTKGRKGRTRPKSDIFTNAVLKEAIEILPELPETLDLEKIRRFLKDRLPFSAESTRRRYSSYVISRIYPNGDPDLALGAFARLYPASQELRDVCFYRFCKAEPLMSAVVEDLLLPGMGFGRLERWRLREYLRSRYPTSRGIAKCAAAVVDALDAGGVAKADRLRISYGYRDPPPASLAFIIHSEFPLPGMYEISELEQSRAAKAMLWNPERLLPGLYELRNLGLLAKVSEIDRFRQFTTRYTLDELVERLKEEEMRPSHRRDI